MSNIDDFIFTVMLLLFTAITIFSVQQCELKGKCIYQTGTVDCNGTLK